MQIEVDVVQHQQVGAGPLGIGLAHMVDAQQDAGVHGPVGEGGVGHDVSSL